MTAPQTGDWPNRYDDLDMPSVVRMQRDACRRAGSPLYATLLEAVAVDVERGGPCAAAFAGRRAFALADAIALRFMGAVHRLVLDGRAPALARHYPSAGGGDAGDPVPAFSAVVEAHAEELRDAMDEPVQTNEAGRSAALVGGFHEVARRTGRPLRALEVGASGGLLQFWDRFHYAGPQGPAGGERAWGDETAPAPLHFRDAWSPATPLFVDELRVAERAACDATPIDVTSPAGVTRLRGFLWPDQVARRARLDAAIDVAVANGVRVDGADAGAWVAARLAEPVAGMATVVYHSIVLQYLPRASFRRMRDAIVAAGESADADAPVAWLRMEPAGPVADVRLRLWPGGNDEVLGTTAYHGPPVDWHHPGHGT